jgi:hypothetical protein
VLFGYRAKETRRAELQSNLAAYQVWRLAWLQRVKKLPKKPDNLTGKGNRRRGTGPDWRAQKAAIELLNAQIGGFDNRKKD